MALVDTSAAKAWVAQFDAEDQEVARYIVSTLRVVSDAELAAFLEGALVATASKQPIAAYAIRKGVSSGYFDASGQCPNRTAAGQGSEELCANAVFAASRSAHGRVLDHPDLETLRRDRVRRIYFVDDASGSGRRASQFIEAFCAHRTIKSWMSGGFIELFVLCYAANAQAIAKCNDVLPGRRWPRRRRRGYRVRFEYHEEVRPGIWTVGTPKALRDQIGSTCKKYGARHGLPKKRILGFGKVLSYVVFEHSCPNNVPAILNCTGKNWVPLFDDRRVGADLVTEIKAGPTTAAESALSVFGQALTAGRAPPDSLTRDALAVLYALGRVRKEDALAHYTGMSLFRVHQILSLCRDLGLVQLKRNLRTERGRTELRRALRSQRAPAPPDLTEHHLYVPKSFRAGQRVV